MVLCHFSVGLYADVVVDLLRTTSGVGRLDATCGVRCRSCRPVGRVKADTAPNCLPLQVPELEVGMWGVVVLPVCLDTAACVK